MFWGLVMNPNKWYTKTVDTSFHVSMATLDITTANDEIVQVILYYKNTNYQLCNLKKDSVWQVPLDLNFRKGSQIAFTCQGQSLVHLTGYLKLDVDTDSDDDSDDYNDGDDDGDDDSDEDDDDDDNDDDDNDNEEDIKKRSRKQNKKYKLMQQQRQKQEKPNTQKLVNVKSKKKKE